MKLIYGSFIICSNNITLNFPYHKKILPSIRIHLEHCTSYVRKHNLKWVYAKKVYTRFEIILLTINVKFMKHLKDKGRGECNNCTYTVKFIEHVLYQTVCFLKSIVILFVCMPSVCIFVAAFVYMDFGLLSPSVLFSISSVLTLVGYVLFDALDKGRLRSTSKRTSKNCTTQGTSMF